MPAYEVAVQISRIHRCTLIIPVDAPHKAQAEVVARAIAREAMDGRRLLKADNDAYLPWTLETAVARTYPGIEDVDGIDLHGHRL